MSSLLLPTTIHPHLSKPRKTKPTITKLKSKKPIFPFCQRKLEPLYDDGYMTPKGVREYHEVVSETLRYNEGPLRWFCPLDSGPPVEDSPLLLFLPGIDGIGMGLFRHHQALGRIFEVRCMHIPFSDRTPLEGLLKFVEDAVRLQHSTCENRQIYLLGHSFGGCLALSVASRNPNIDLILILTNPATSFGRLRFLPLFTIRDQQYIAAQVLMMLSINPQIKHALESYKELGTFRSLNELQSNLVSSLMNLSRLVGNILTETIPWKLELLKSAAAHANSRLHSVNAEVLVLAGCLDSLLPSRDEGARLATLVQRYKVCYFQKLGHNILMEDGVHISSIIKSSGLYRHKTQHDCIKDFLPTTKTELQQAYIMQDGLYILSSPVMFSTMEDGKIVRGLSGIPNDGPVLLVGNHMMLGVDMSPLVTEFLSQKSIVLRGMAHPVLFKGRRECSCEGRHVFDFVRLFGAVPVSHKNMYRLFSEKSFVLLYPGGSREALHRKGEEYKLFWPAQPEFVRMAAKFGAKIIPFGAVGEDDLGELFLDYNDLTSIPFVKDKIREGNQEITRLRNDASGIDQDLFIPFVRPKIPGRYYYLFGKPISMSEKIEVLKERDAANTVYLQVKSEVESLISYLLKKREEDAYRSILNRSIYRAIWGSSQQIPSFDP